MDQVSTSSWFQPSFNITLTLPSTPHISDPREYEHKKDIFLGRALQFASDNNCDLQHLHFFKLEDILLDFEGKFTKALDKAFQKKLRLECLSPMMYRVLCGK